MSAALNKSQLIGYLGADPDVKHLREGGRVANLSVATSDSWTDKESGEKVEKTEWHRVVIYNEALIDKVVEPFLHKGSRIYIEGKLETHKWQDRDGNDRYSTEIVLRPFRGDLSLLDAPKSSPTQPEPRQRRSNSGPEAA